MPHIHTGYELYFCPEDITQRTVICGIQYEYTHHSAILSRPYTLHSMSCLEDCKTDYRRYVFDFGDGIAAKLGFDIFSGEGLDGKMGVLFKLSVAEAEYIERFIRVSFLEGNSLSERESVFLLSFIISRLYGLTSDGRTIGVGSSSFYVQNVLKYISENYDKQITAEMLAEKFSVSRSKLDRDFKNSISTTPKDFIETCRLTNSKYLLAYDHEMNIAEVAERCGFVSEQYFYRFFKKHTGKTPGEYRKNNDVKKGV
jgi:AraC-like DNA-binding protein